MPGDDSGFYMSETATRQNKIIVGTATIAADLHKIMEIAWTVSIAAKNALIISAQAGEAARGFPPITRYIDEITRSTLDNTERVEQESIQLTRYSARYLHTLDATRRYQQVFRQAADAQYLQTLQLAYDKCHSRLSEEQHSLSQHLQALILYLEELDQNMRAALAVAAVCRIEASRAGEFRQNLSVVSDDLDKAAREIQLMLRDGLKRISAIQAESQL